MAKMAKQSASPPPGLVKHDYKGLGTLDASSYDTKGTATTADDEMYFGDGNLPTNYNISVDQKAGIELGLKIHYRTGNDILPTSFGADGTAYYTAPDGPQVVDPANGVYSANANRSAWNFDFSVNTGIGGSTKTLDDFDFRIVIADDDGNVRTFDLQHLGPGNTPWLTEAGPAAGGFADEDGANPQLSQNSVNFGFAFMAAAFGPDHMAAGETYDITLQAFDLKGKIIAQVHDVIFLA